MARRLCGTEASYGCPWVTEINEALEPEAKLT
jgi:hypothetical protein